MRHAKLELAAIAAMTAVLVVSSSVATAQPPGQRASVRELIETKERVWTGRGQGNAGPMERIALRKDLIPIVREPPGPEVKPDVVTSVVNPMPVLEYQQAQSGLGGWVASPHL
jgi:hypothetical protein